MTKSNDIAIVVTTLGTGAPVLDPNRFSQSILVEAAGHQLLFDTGRGAVLRLVQAGVKPASVSQLFFTHYHSDHTVGFADFWLSSWLPAGGGRKSSLTVSGPTGVEALIEGHRLAFADDISIRMADQNLPREGTEINVRSFDKSGVVFDKDGVVVTSFDSNHGEKIKPNWGYKIEYDGKTVVISGDTKFDPMVANMAKEVDLLLHSFGAAREGLLSNPDVAGILQHHTSPVEAGEIFAIAQPKLAVLIHMVLLGRPGYPPLTPDEVLALMRESYQGPVVVAEDLMRFEVGDHISVIPWSPPAGS